MSEYLSDHRIAFEKIEWNKTGVGVKQKVFQYGNQRFRQVEFSEGFVELDWCMKGHACYVLEGCFSIDFNGNIERYSTGNVCFIPMGENDKHKAILGKGDRVLLLMFEIVEG